MDFIALRVIIIACLLKLLMKTIDSLLAVEQPSHFHLVLRNTTEPGHPTGTCQFSSKIRSYSGMSAATEWIYSARYLLPVIGGIMSTRAWLGYKRVLHIGGFTMLLSTVLLSVSMYLGLMCQASPIIPIIWLLLPVFFGLTQPNILYCMFKWFVNPHLATIMSAMYYITAIGGKFMAQQLQLLARTDFLGPNSSLVSICVSVFFLLLSFLLPNNQLGWEPFHVPHRLRLKRYFKIFSGVTLLFFTEADTKAFVYNAELAFHLNGTDYVERHFAVSPEIASTSVMLLFCFVHIIIASRQRRLPICLRMQLSVLIKTGVTASLMIFNMIGSSSCNTVVAVYMTVFILDAIARSTLMIAAYDLLQQVLPGAKGAECFVIGVMLTVWGIANVASQVALKAMSGLIFDGETNAPVRSYIYHAVMLAALLACFAYQKFVALPMAIQVTPIEHLEEEEQGREIDDELQPLRS